MLDRKRVLERNAEVPRRLHRIARDSIGRMTLLCPTGKLEDAMTETDVRCRYAEEAALCWMKQNQSDPYVLLKFQEKLGFDWEDVRNAEHEQSVIDHAHLRMKMAEEEFKDGKKGIGDALIAMSVVEYWLRTATNKYGDCTEEFLYLSTQLSTFLLPKKESGSLVENILNLSGWSTFVGYGLGITLLWMIICYVLRLALPKIAYIILYLLIIYDAASLVEIFLMTCLIQKRMDWLFEKPQKS